MAASAGVFGPAVAEALAVGRRSAASPAACFCWTRIGELASLYQLADLAFIGGSLVPRGGHNVLEAALFGAPILVGPHTENFRDIVEVFRRRMRCAWSRRKRLTATVLQLLED